MKVILCLLISVACAAPLFAQPEQSSTPVTTTESLSQSLEQYNQPIDPETIVSQYNEVSELWQQVALHLKSLFHRLPDSEVQGTDQSMQDWQAEVSKRFSLLRRAGRERARYLEELQNQNLSLFKVDNETFQRMGIEVTLIPYKFVAYFYEKAYWFRSQLNEGFSGFYYLVIELLILLAILLIPFVFVKLSRRIEKQIDLQKRRSFYLSYRSSWHRSLTNTLPVITEYMPWLFALVAIRVVGWLLQFSEFKEFSYLLPYFNYFVFYKLFRVTLELGLREFVSHLPMDSKENLNQKIQNTSKFLGLLLFGIYSVKTAFQSILGQSLIFSFIEPFFGILILLLLFYVSARWEIEIEKYLRNTNILVFQKYSKRMENRYSLFLSLPGLVLILAHFTARKLIEWSSQFEFVKLLYARVLRVKYESTRGDTSGLSLVGDEYREKFLAHCEGSWKDYLFEREFFKKIEAQVSHWNQEDNTEQTVAIYGPKGSGKSIFLNQAGGFFEEKGYNVLHLSVPERVFSEKSFEQTFEPIFSLPEDQKTIVFLDNAHNLFLSTIGGFKIYQQFLEKTEELKQVFWVATYNEYSWQFLNSVLGKNQYFRLELQIPRWTAQEIKEMILSFHEKMKYQIEYDQIFRSNQRLNEEVASAESRYFYLIWERCNGNPGMAIYYWFKSLRVINDSKLKVCLPAENPVGELSQLHQEMHFVYASLLKHENLNISEASRATNLPRSVVKQAIFRGIEEGFLTERDNRYCVGLDWLDDLKRYLRGKNLIYEING